MKKLLLNKTDETYILSLIILIISIFSPVILLFTAIEHNIEFLFEVFFIFTVISYILVVPTCLITQIITFIIKLLKKNKNIKDWILTLLNFMTIVFFSFLISCIYLSAIVL